MSGFVSLLVIALAPAAAPVPIPRTAFLSTMDAEFARMDSNKDGIATRAEIEAYERAGAEADLKRRAAEAFARLDSDHDGQLSLAEFMKVDASIPLKVDAGPLLAQSDLNRDGKITLVEHRTAKLANFDRMDTDKDGVVTPAEMKAAGLIK
jgi:Ca2+-binding EF-hand superfamily protein